MSRPRLLALLLVLITLAAYLPVAHHGFLTYDDDDYVTSNPMVQRGLTLDGFIWAFTTFHAGNWHPLTWISLMADCSLFGLNAGAIHFVNALFHAGNVALVFLLLWRLTAKIGPSALVAALFAWHPLHVESVAWISERKDVLSTFFGLMCLLNYGRFVQAKSLWHYYFALVCFVLSLMAKPMLVTLPFVLLLLDYWPLQRFSFATFRISFLSEKTPFFIVAAASCVVTFIAQKSGQAVVSLLVLPLHYRVENAVVADAWYLMKIFWPADLAVIYPFVLYPAATIVAALALLLLLSAGAWWARNHNRCWLVGWCWFLGTLVPVCGLVQVGGTATADRYTYFPSIGIFIALAFGLSGAACLARFKNSLRIGTALLLVVCIFLTEKQLSYWRNSELLFRHTVAVTKNNLIARLSLGIALDRQNQPAEALVEYREVARLEPNYPEIHFYIGNLEEKLDNPAEALAEYRLCLSQSPGNPVYHCAAGVVLVRQGLVQEALAEFDQAEHLAPHYAEPWIETAKIYFQQSREGEAVAALHAAVRAEPDNFQVLATAAHHLAANSNAAARNGQAALALALKADALSGHVQPVVQDYLGMAYAETGDFSNAILCAQNAINLAAAARMNDLRPFQKRLALYQRHQPWRESFASPNIPGNGPASGGAK